MNTQFSERDSARDSINGDAICVAVFTTGLPHPANRMGATGPSKAVAATLVLLLGLLGGCGGSSSTDSASIDEPLSSDAPIEATTPVVEDAGEAASEESAPVVESSSTSADVLLLEPAGSPELPVGQTPSVKFKTTQSSEEESAGNADPNAPLNSLNAETDVVSGNVTVSWDPPNLNADGTSLNDLAGYRVYQGDLQQLAIVQELNDTGTGERRLTQIPDVTNANSCFAVTAYDTSANESSLGDVVCKEVITAAPPVNSSAPTLNSVIQLSTAGGQASIGLNWQAPTEFRAGEIIEGFNIFYGTQSQLFKIQEITLENARDNGSYSTNVSDIGGEQACFALTARFADNLESSLGEIACIALVHTTPPQPGTELRPFNVTVDILAENRALVGWDKPNTVVTTPDATAIDRYDLFQGSASQVFKITEIAETGAANIRRTTTVENVFANSNCFALTATDQSQRHSALSTIVCGTLPDGNGPPPPSVPDNVTLGVTNLTAQETSPGDIALGWDAPQLIAVGQPISNLEDTICIRAPLVSSLEWPK